MKFNFEKIKRKLSKAAVKTKETSGIMVEMAKLKYKIVEIKCNIDDNYKAIGKLVYNAAEDEDIRCEVNKLREKLASLIEAKNDMQTRYDELINKKQCPKCENRIEKDFDFCPKCGYKFED